MGACKRKAAPTSSTRCSTSLCEGLRRLAILLHPVMPERMEEMWRRLGLGERDVDADWRASLAAGAGIPPGTHTSLGDPLFPRIEL